MSVLLAGAAGSGWLAWRRTGSAHRLSRVDPAAANAEFKSKVLPVLNKYCWDCHADGEHKGDLALDGFTNAAAVFQNRRAWEQVLQNIKSGDMPPRKKKEQPTDQERTLVTGWIERTLFPIDPDHPDPGRVTLRRLNRAEYNNTIRDLVGVDFHPADDFPADDLGYGFDNIGDVLSMPPLLLEKYLRAAEQVLDAALVTGPRPPPSQNFKPVQMEGGSDNGPVRGLASNGELSVRADFPAAGRYLLRFTGYGQQAGPDPVKAAIRLEGRTIREVDVPARAGNAGRYDAEVTVAASGRQRYSVAFLNDYYVEKWVTKERKGQPAKKEKVVEDRNFYCESMEVLGPLGVEQPLPATHLRVFAATPSAGQDLPAAREDVRRFVRRAWRRPPSAGELDRLMALYYEAKANGENFEASVKHVLTAVLVSPHFLFRNETQPQPDNPGALTALDDHALASRLSYFLWSSMPDDELLDLADQGKLRKRLDAQLQRMLHDPKAAALTKNFASQWLGLRALDLIDPDRGSFPAFNDEVRRGMRRETEAFFDHVVSNDRPVTEFLDGKYTFVNQALAEYYGLTGVSGPEFREVSLAGTPREGILTQGSILTLTSNPTRTSPVKRGKWVLENLLGTPPPPPPPNVPPLEAGEKLQGTLRQRMEKHRENAMCASCHNRMDPIGFAFEHFDGTGRWRDTDGKDAVEPSGQLATGEKFADHQQLIGAFATSRRDDFLRCLVEKTLTFALGRGLEYYDRPAVDKILADVQKDGFKFSAIISGVTHSVPFLWRRGEGDPAAPSVASN